MPNIECSGPFCSEMGSLAQMVDAVRLTKMFNLASLVLFIYDFVSTFDREVNIMWGAKFGFGKLLYFSVRYYALTFLIFINFIMFFPGASDQLCDAWIIVQWVSGVVLGFLTELSLQLRVYAMYGGSRKILLFLVTLTIASLSSSIFVTTKIIMAEQASMVDLGDESYLYICDVLNLPAMYKVYWTPALINETILVGLALRAGILDLKTLGLKNCTNRLAIVLMRDSALYFIAVFATLLVGQLLWIFKSEDYMEIPVGIAISMESILSQKLLLNIREHYSNNFLDEDSCGAECQSELLLDLARGRVTVV